MTLRTIKIISKNTRKNHFWKPLPRQSRKKNYKRTGDRFLSSHSLQHQAIFGMWLWKLHPKLTRSWSLVGHTLGNCLTLHYPLPLHLCNLPIFKAVSAHSLKASRVRVPSTRCRDMKSLSFLPGTTQVVAPREAHRRIRSEIAWPAPPVTSPDAERAGSGGPQSPNAPQDWLHSYLARVPSPPPTLASLS